MAARIIIFGATGHTGRLTAERLAAAGAAPVLAGRSEASVRELAEKLGCEWRQADALRQNSVFALLEPGDVLLTTVGPFLRWGEPAVRAAIAAGGIYIDSTGEPAFVRRVFEELGPAATRANASLLTAMGYDYVPGALAGALALEQAGEAAVRVDVGYYAFGITPSAGTRRSSVGFMLGDGFAYRDGRVQTIRIAERVRTFEAKGKPREAASIGGSEHFTLPEAYPRLREVNVYLGWLGRLSKPLQVASLAGSYATRVPGVRAALQAVGERVVEIGSGGDAPRGEGLSYVVGAAYDAAGEQLAEVHLSGTEPYALTAGILAWAARRAADTGVSGTGALGPVAAFGLAELEAGCREAGLERVSAS